MAMNISNASIHRHSHNTFNIRINIIIDIISYLCMYSSPKGYTYTILPPIPSNQNTYQN